MARAWGIEHRAWRKDRRGEWFSKVRRRFNFKSREFLIISILAQKTTILGLKTAIYGTII
jgi:hypothetical protein